MSQTQYVIMFNDCPEEVCAPGTTQQQAEDRAKQVKSSYLNFSQGSVPASTLHIRAREVKVWTPQGEQS